MDQFFTDPTDAEAKYLLRQVHRVYDWSLVQVQFPFSKQVVALLSEDVDPFDLLEWNRTHKKGGLFIRSCEQFLNAVNGSGNYHLLNEYLTHDFAECPICKKKGLFSPDEKRRRYEAQIAQEDRERVLREKEELNRRLPVPPLNGRAEAPQKAVPNGKILFSVPWFQVVTCGAH